MKQKNPTETAETRTRKVDSGEDRSFPLCRLWLSGILLLLLAPAVAQAINDPSLLPEGRQRLELRPAERNPFTQQIAAEAAPAATQELATEEARLRKILRAVKIGGVSGTPGNRQVLLGSLIVKPGEILAPILKNQFEVLRVVSVDERSIVLAFVERDPSVEARKIVLPYDIKPEVTKVMYGEAFEELTKVTPSGRISAPPLTNPGVEDFLKGSREADLRNMTDRDVQMMGVVNHAEQSKPEK